MLKVRGAFFPLYSMKIAVNTRFLIPGKLEGIGVYTQEIFKRVVQLMPEHQFYFLFDRQYASEFVFADNVIPIRINPPARHPFLWYWWFEHSIPKVLRNIAADVFISPDGFATLRTSVPQILTIHDLGFEHYPEHTPFLVHKYYQHFTPKYCQKAAKILSVSAFTKQDIIDRYKINAAKIEVVYNGFSPIDPIAAANKTQVPYFIFVGAVHPRKNILGLLKAFETFKQKYTLPHQLVIVGRKAWMLEEVETFYAQMKFKNEVIWKEHCARELMLQWMQQAEAMVYPSWFEGFGIPIVEAMHLGIPVIASQVSAIPEVAGNAALYIHPENKEEIADAMYKIVTDTKLRAQLIENGKLRAQYFSWDLSAQKVAEIIRGYEKKL